MAFTVLMATICCCCWTSDN